MPQSKLACKLLRGNLPPVLNSCQNCWVITRAAENVPDQSGGIEISNGNILEHLCGVRFGAASAENLRKLQDELQQFRKLHNTKPTRQGIDDWFKPKPTKPTRTDARQFLLGYVEATVDRDRLSTNQLSILEAVYAFLSGPDTSRASPKAPIARPSKPDQLRTMLSDPVTVEIIKALIEKGRQGRGNEIDDFFYCSPQLPPNHGLDQSYYAVYRYSTISGSILKTFLVCKQPPPHIPGPFSFVNFVRGGSNFQEDIVRESQGLILKYENAYHFLGYSYRISADKQTDPQGYRWRRKTAKANPLAIELLVTEYSDLRLERGLFSGLTFTIAAGTQPVAARIAFLHLATKGSIGREISDDDVIPTELESENLAKDLRDLIARLRSNSDGKLARLLQGLAGRADWTESGSESLANRIKQMIDNTPAWETSPDNPNQLKNAHAHGALETFGPRGSRPRP